MAGKNNDAAAKAQEEATGKVEAGIPTGKTEKTVTCKGGTKVCGQIITGESLECDGCKFCYHWICQGLSYEAYVAISKHKLLWLCLECKPNLMTMLATGRQINLRISEAENKIMSAMAEAKPSSALDQQAETRIERIEKSFSELKEQQNRVERSIKEQKEAVQEMKEQQNRVECSIKEQKEVVQGMPKVSQDLKSSADQLRRIMETRDKESRETNIILHNIPESLAQDSEARKGYDADSFYNVAFSLLGDVAGIEVQEVRRLGKRAEGQDGSEREQLKPRLMLVKLKHKEVVDELIKRRTQLKDVGFPNVYLTKDMSPDERERM